MMKIVPNAHVIKPQFSFQGKINYSGTRKKVAQCSGSQLLGRVPVPGLGDHFTRTLNKLKMYQKMENNQEFINKMT